MWITRTCAVAVLAMVVPAHADAPAKTEGEPHWSYTSGITPPKWGEVAPTCATGKTPSPIALSTRTAKAQPPPPAIAFAWSKATGELVDTGHSEQVNLPPGNFLTYGGTRYELVQFHFHTPSENTIDGKAAPMEVHFVHRSVEGKLVVVGVMLKQGTAPSPFAVVLTALPAAGQKRSVDVDLPAMLPKTHRHFAFAGSLTTPPCSEDVQWIVMLAPDPVSRAEIDDFRAKYPKNARPVQPLKGRTVAIGP
jgi:carbonic anhydrase